MERAGKVFADHIKQAPALNPPNLFEDFAKHSSSHVNYPVLYFLLNRSLCHVTEALLLQAVDAYSTRKTSGLEWKEPAEIVDLLPYFVHLKP